YWLLLGDLADVIIELLAADRAAARGVHPHNNRFSVRVLAHLFKQIREITIISDDAIYRNASNIIAAYRRKLGIFFKKCHQSENGDDNSNDAPTGDLAFKADTVDEGISVEGHNALYRWDFLENQINKVP